MEESATATHEAAEAATDRTRRTAQLGVLFVHGIGQQARGETLVHWLDPLIEWTSAWLVGAHPLKRGDPLPTCIVHRAHLTAEREPAHAHVTIAAPAGWVADTAVESRLVFAEAYWADSYPAPSAAEVSAWLLEIGPMTLLQHAGVGVRRAWRDRSAGSGIAGRARALTRVGGALLGLVVAMALLPLVLALLLLLSALRFIPIPGVANAVLARIQSVLAAVIGDASVFAASPARLAAIVTEVRSTIAWLEPQCDRMIVVAHSQGAAVLRHALHEDAVSSWPKNLGGIVTLGAGLRKLDVLLSAHRDRARGERGDATLHTIMSLFARAATIIGGLALTAGAVGVTIMPRWVVILFALLLGANLVLYALIDLEPDAPTRRWWDAIRAVRPNAEWLDLYASHDPVSNGAMWDEGAPSGATSLAVFNARSTIADHTAYWDNRAGFVARVAAFLARVGRLDVPLHHLKPDDTALVEREAVMRGLRIWLVDALFIALCIAAIGALAFGSDAALSELGESLRAHLLHTTSQLGMDRPPGAAGRWLTAASAITMARVSYALMLLACWLVARTVKQLWIRVGAYSLAQHDAIDVNLEAMALVLLGMSTPVAGWWFLHHGGFAMGPEWAAVAVIASLSLWGHHAGRIVRAT